MPTRHMPSRAFTDGILLHDADDERNPLRLYFDYGRFAPKPYRIPVRFSPTGPAGFTGDGIQEWNWSNGPAGAGTTLETPQSYGQGASEYGERVWLRRKGAAMPAGATVEYDMPVVTGALTNVQFSSGMVYGGDLWITTLGQTVVKVTGAGLGVGLLEQDFGAGAQTLGTAVFNGSGTSCLYIGEFVTGIREYDGAAWRTGEAGTNRAWLETPYWAIGSQLATGGTAGTAGDGATRLVGTDLNGTGFYHVSGHPRIAANWSSLEIVGTGSTAYPIQRTAATNRDVLFGTGQGVYSVNGLGYSPNQTKWMELAASINNNAAITYWNGLIWAAHETGLITFAPTGERIDLGQYVQFGARTGAGPIFGRPLALAPAPDGLYVGYYNAGNQTSYVGCLVIDQDGSYRWSMAEAVLSGQIVTYLQQVIDSNGAPGLFIGTVDTTTDKMRLHRQYLPKYGDPVTDILNSGPFVAATDWSVRLSRSDGGRPVSKTFRRYNLEADYLGTDYPDNFVNFDVATNGGAFSTVGTATGSSIESTRWTSVPTGTFVKGTDFQIRLTVHNNTLQPVVIRTAGLWYEPQPERARKKTYAIQFSNEHTGYDPRVAVRTVERAQQLGPQRITDEFGRVVEGTIDWVEEDITQEAPGKSWVIHGSVTVSTTQELNYYDDGVIYDGGDPYSL